MSGCGCTVPTPAPARQLATATTAYCSYTSWSSYLKRNVTWDQTSVQYLLHHNGRMDSGLFPASVQMVPW